MIHEGELGRLQWVLLSGAGLPFAGFQTQRVQRQVRKEGGQEKELGVSFSIAWVVRWGRGGSKVLSTFCPQTDTSHPGDFAHVPFLVSNPWPFSLPLCVHGILLILPMQSRNIILMVSSWIWSSLRAGLLSAFILTVLQQAQRLESNSISINVSLWWPGAQKPEQSAPKQPPGYLSRVPWMQNFRTGGPSSRFSWFYK